MNEQVQLKILQQMYRNRPLTNIEDAGFRIFSQDDEDGIIHYIFSRIGTTNKICAEIAYPEPMGGNTTNLLINGGWSGILVCGKKKEATKVSEYYASRPDVLYKPSVRLWWVTAANINDIIRLGLADLSALNTPTPDIDFLSIDIDGVDYWVWEALNSRPRVVSIEYHRGLGNKSVVIPYDPLFDRTKGDPDYRSASLRALTRLGKSKGYKLVSCSRLNTNAFFVREDCCGDLKEYPVDWGLSHPITARDHKISGDLTKKFTWMEV
jgi:hypothetical protein